MKIKLWFLGWALVLAGMGLPQAATAAQNLPEGSYQYTCIGCVRNLDMLTCSCPDNSGKMMPANIHLAGCNREISNRNGQLVCG